MIKRWHDEAWNEYVNKQGYWSRRIDEANRIVYKVERDEIIIAQCGGHYDD